MYLAEIRGKLSRENENKEDILTSNVFSFFKYADREVFLRPFLELLGLDVTAQDARQAEFSFWPSYPDGTEPDLVLLAGKYYLLIEAKYHSGFGAETPHTKAQLLREIEGGEFEAHNLDKVFRIITITAHHYFKPEIYLDIPEEFGGHHKWINWQQIAYLIYSILEDQPDIQPETKLFAEDLYQLLLKKNLRNYEGIAVLSEMHGLLSPHEAIFFDARTASYRGDFLGFVPSLQTLSPISGPHQYIFFNTQRSLFADLVEGSSRFLVHSDPIFWRK